jgi:cyclase
MNHKHNALLFAMAICIGIGSSFAQPAASKMTTQKLTDHIFMVRGGVANTGFVIGNNGVLVIDANMSVEDTHLTLDEIRKTTPLPVSMLILTHSDGDHVNGIGGYPQGIEIIAHEQAKKEMEAAFKAPDLQSLRAWLPGKTFNDEMNLVFGSEKIRLLYFGPAHTSGDAVVFFPDEKLAFIGDLVFLGRDPVIHTEKGGSSTGILNTLKALLEMDAERYVPGHNDVVTKSDISAEIKSIEEKQEKIKPMIQQGKSLDEVKKAMGIVDSPANAGGFRFPSLVEIIYNEFTSPK